LAEQAKGVLKQLLAGQRPGIEDLARNLHLSTRTLQRRLTKQGLTFQCLLEEARRELARHYLVHSSRELNETAYLLGYEDANSFFRAFHHWEGTTPGQWRAIQKNSRPTTREAWANIDIAGADGVNANVLCRVVEGSRPGEADHAMFRRGVGIISRPISERMLYARNR
jgi:AraC-like DNA-binding protein